MSDAKKVELLRWLYACGKVTELQIIINQYKVADFKYLVSENLASYSKRKETYQITELGISIIS